MSHVHCYSYYVTLNNSCNEVQTKIDSTGPRYQVNSTYCMRYFASFPLCEEMLPTYIIFYIIRSNGEPAYSFLWH